MTRTNNKVSLTENSRNFASRKRSLTPKFKRTSNSTTPNNRKRKRNRALKEIKFYQQSTNLLIQKLPFMRLVKEVLDELRPQFGYRWQESALMALQEMAENYLTSLFEDSNIVALNSKRVTIKVEDMQVVRRIRGPMDIANR